MENTAANFRFTVIVKFENAVGVSLHYLKVLTYPFEPKRLLTSVSDLRLCELVRRAQELDTSYQPTQLLNYYGFDCRNEEEVRTVVRQVEKVASVERVQVETLSAAPPSLALNKNPLCACQGYLNAAPTGIDARYAWGFEGGDGSGAVRFIDIEQGWLTQHEDLVVNEFASSGINHQKHRDHGAAVLGVVMMRNNDTGGIGIVPNVNGYIVSQWRPDGTCNTADALTTAIELLSFGDVLLLETQAIDLLETKKTWPLETLDVHYQLIRLATALGITVIEPAGNGIEFIGHDLNESVDDLGKVRLNPQDCYFRDSGAVVVAAASSNVPHSRLSYSNYGPRVDCYAWGEDVVTAGNFPRSSGSCLGLYSANFCGTSSASAIIAGAAIAVQSIAESNYGFRLGARQMRTILSDPKYGTESKSGHKIDKIGVMPDLKKIIDYGLKEIAHEHHTNRDKADNNLKAKVSS